MHLNLSSAFAQTACMRISDCIRNQTNYVGALSCDQLLHVSSDRSQMLMEKLGNAENLVESIE